MSQALPASTVPALRRGVKLRFDQARETWVLLAPEKAFVLDAIAAEVLQLVDGERTIEGIVAALVAKFGAPDDVIAGDVDTLLDDLARRGAVKL